MEKLPLSPRKLRLGGLVLAIIEIMDSEAWLCWGQEKCFGAHTVLVPY